MSTTLEKVQAALAALPESADEIAALFREKDVKGYRSEPCACPVARYLVKETEVLVSVSPTTARLAWSVSDAMRLSDGVTTFINNFDLGRYPDLEAS